MASINPHNEVLFHRHPNNPILTAEQWPYPMHTVGNPAATVLSDGTTLLLCRVEDRRGMTHLCAARSRNGVDSWQVDAQPTMAAQMEHTKDVWGLEDPRMTYIPESGRYAVTYVTRQAGGATVALATTSDVQTFERYGHILPPDNSGAVLFPRRFGENWALIHQPGDSDIWISYSPDLRHWGSHKSILHARQGAWWDASTIRLSAPPIETAQGWLLLYHSMQPASPAMSDRLGLALFELQAPERCMLRGDAWLFAPETNYERTASGASRIFASGYTMQSDGDTLSLYYGAGDGCVALATASIRQLLDWLHRHGQSEE